MQQTSSPPRGRPGGSSTRLLRLVALTALVVGAAGSVGLMFWVGRRNPSALLLVLFTLWVLSPFVALAAAHNMSSRSSASIRAALEGVMLVVAICSLAIYGDVAFGHPRPQPAAMFLLVPLGSWLLIAIVVGLATFVSRPLR